MKGVAAVTQYILLAISKAAKPMKNTKKPLQRS
jgi:hypothetical protein